MKKEEDINDLQPLRIDKATILEERSIKMSKKMVQHLSQESKVTHEYCVIKGKVGGQAEGPPNFEQPAEVRENNGNNLSHIFESMKNK